MRVAVCGFYGKSNFGDDLMADCLAERLGRTGCEVSLYSDNERGPSIRNGLKDKSYLDADAVVVGGGNIIGPGFWAFKDGGLGNLAAARKLVFLNVGVTPDYLSDDRFVSQLRDLGATWKVRDAESVELLAQVGIEATYLPDVSFTLSPGCRRKDKVVAVFLNDYPLGDLHKDESVERFLRSVSVAKLIAHHLDWLASFGWKIRLVPCHVSKAIDDRLPAATVYSWMKRRHDAEVLMSPMDWRGVLDEVSSAGLVMSMRYHASTCAFASGVPLLDLTHHAKNRRLMNSLGAEKCAVNVWSCTHEDLIKATQEAERVDVRCGLEFKEDADKLWRLFDDEWRALTLDGEQI